jgi:hypothetical protein
LVKTRLEQGLIFRTGSRIGPRTGFLVPFICRIEIETEPEPDILKKKETRTGG